MNKPQRIHWASCSLLTIGCSTPAQTPHVTVPRYSQAKPSQSR